MSDTEAIQGLWRVESITSRGQAVGYSVTHWEFQNNRVQEINPDHVDGGEWATLVLDSTTTPKRIDKTYQIKRDGETVSRTFKECYALNGDLLKIGGAQIFGQYPDVIDDAYSTVTTLTRCEGPRPQTKQASGKVPLESSVLGTLTWNDDLDQWEAVVDFAPFGPVNISLPQTGDVDASKTLTQGEALVEWLRTHEANARTYAADTMTELAEDWRDEDEEPDIITPELFAARIELSAITVEADGETTLWYNDDDIFAGHIIAVSMDAAQNFTDAQMMG